MKQPDSPLALCKVVVVGSVLALLGYLCNFLPGIQTSDVPSGFQSLLWQSRYELLVSVAPFLTGTILCWYGWSRLKRGIDKVSWNEEQLNQTHRWISAGWLTRAQITVIVCLTGFWIYARLHDNRAGFFIPALLIVTNPLSYCRQLLRKPSPSEPRSKWAEAAPIHSSHWGQPPTTV